MASVSTMEPISVVPPPTVSPGSAPASWAPTMANINGAQIRAVSPIPMLTPRKETPLPAAVLSADESVKSARGRYPSPSQRQVQVSTPRMLPAQPGFSLLPPSLRASVIPSSPFPSAAVVKAPMPSMPGGASITALPAGSSITALPAGASITTLPAGGSFNASPVRPSRSRSPSPPPPGFPPPEILMNGLPLLRSGSVQAPVGGGITPRREGRPHSTTLTPRPDGRQVLAPAMATGGAPMWSQVMAAATSSGAASPMVAWPQVSASRSGSPVPLMAQKVHMQAGAGSRSASPAGRNHQPATVMRTTRVLGNADSLAQQLQALQQAKTLVAHQQAGFAQELASRQDQLRRETLQALRSTPAVPGLTEALKRWPSPRQDMPRGIAASLVQASPAGSLTMAAPALTATTMTTAMAPSAAQLITTAPAKSADYIMEVQPAATAPSVLLRATGTVPAADDLMVSTSGSAQLSPWAEGSTPAMAQLGLPTTVAHVPATSGPGASVVFASEQGLTEEVAMTAKPMGTAPAATLPVLSPPAAPVIAARVLTGTDAVMGVRTGTIESPAMVSILAEDTEGVSGTTEQTQTTAAYQMTSELPSAEIAAERAAAAAVAAAATDAKPDIRVSQGAQYPYDLSQDLGAGVTAPPAAQLAPRENEQPAQPDEVIVVERPVTTPRGGPAGNRNSSPSNRQSSPGASGRQSSPGNANRQGSPSGRGGGSNRQSSPAASSPPPRAGRASERRAAPKQGSSASSPPSHVVQAELAKCQQTINWCADTITKQHIDIMRKIMRPSQGLKKILECVGILFGVANASEPTGRKILTGNVQEKIRGINLDEITLAQFRRIRRLLVLPDFDEETVKSACKEALPLAIWCRSIGIFLGKTRFAGWAGPEIQSMGVSVDDALQSPDTSAIEQPPADPYGDSAAGTRPGEQPAAAIDDRSSVEMGGLLVMPDLTRLNPRDMRQVSELTVGRPEVGSITFHGLTDCTGLEIPRLVHLDVGEVLVYPEPGSKAPVGQGLNKRATVTMYQCWPPNGRGHLEDSKAQERYRWKIQQMTEEKRAKFIDYDCNTGIWKFQVEHF